MTFKRLAALLSMFGALLASTHSTIADTDAVVYHDMASIPKETWGAFPEFRAVLTETTSVAIATLAPRYKQPMHRHDQEQFSLGLGGAVGYSVGDAHHDVGAHVVVLPPSNVMHGMDNDSDQPALVMEFQPVLRREFLPPHAQAPPQPQSTEPVPLAADRMVTLDFDRSSDGWRVERNGARVKVFDGKTIRASFWDLGKKGAFVDVAERHSSRERVVFVLDGVVASSAESTRREIGPQMLVEVRPLPRASRWRRLVAAPRSSSSSKCSRPDLYFQSTPGELMCELPL